MASHHHTNEQYVKQEKDEAIAEKIISLANDEDKHDKPEGAKGEATSPSKTEGDEVKTELSEVETEKPNDSPALEPSAEDILKHDKVEDAQNSTSPTEDDDKKVDPDAAEKTEKDNLNEEKELILAAEPVHDEAKSQQEETPQKLENEPVETIDEEKQPKTSDVSEVSAEAIEESSNSVEANPQTESEAEIFDTSALKEEKPDPVVTEVKEKIEEPEKESPEAEILESSLKEEEKLDPVGTEAQDKTEESEKESQEAEILESALKEEKPEPVGIEVQDKIEEPEKESQEAEQTSSVAISETSVEADEKPSDAVEGKTTETSADELKETNNNVVEEPKEAVKAEPVVAKVEENQKEPEKQSYEGSKEEQANNSAVLEQPSETSNAIEEKTRELDFEAESLKENETGPAETEKAEVVVTTVDENRSETETQSFKEEEEKKPVENAEQPGEVVEVHPPKDLDTEEVKDAGNSEPEAVQATEEKTEPLSSEVEKKPKEQLQVGDEAGETKQEIVVETSKNGGTLDDAVKDPISSKNDKTDIVEETSLTVDTAQVSSNGEAHAISTNSVEPSPEVGEKAVEEDGKKESSLTEQASTDEEAKTNLKEESENVVPAGVEEKVVDVENDDKKESEESDVVPESSKEAEVETKTVEEQNKAKTATAEGENVKVVSVKEDVPAIDPKKEGNADTKVEEISTAASEHVRETLASKFEQKEEEESTKTGENKLEKEKILEPVKTEVQATKEIDATNASKDLPKETPAKPAQKQSNNIISKVKQSLVKAKKAITGKSPSSKNLSSEAKGDIKVK